MKSIGFIGTGLMGFPMAKNLLKSGFKLRVFNRTIEKAIPLKKFGAEISTSIKEAVKDQDVIITMLTDDAAIEDVMKNVDFIEFYVDPHYWYNFCVRLIYFVLEIYVFQRKNIKNNK